MDVQSLVKMFRLMAYIAFGAAVVLAGFLVILVIMLESWFR